MPLITRSIFPMLTVCILLIACSREPGLGTAPPVVPAATRAADSAGGAPEAEQESPAISTVSSSSAIDESNAGAGQAATPVGMATALPAFRLPQEEEPGWLVHRTADPLPRTAFSPAGDVLATGHRDGTVILWDLASGRQVQVLDGPGGDNAGEITALAFSPDGSLLAAAKPFAGRVDLWQVSTGGFERSLEDVQGVSEVAFSPDGGLLAGGIGRGQDPSALGQVILWNTGTWVRQAILEDVAPPVVFSEDGSTLATVAGMPLTAMGPEIEPGAVVLWDVASGQQVEVIEPDGYVVSSDYDSERQMVAANVLQSLEVEPGYASRTLLLDTTTGETLLSLDAPAEGEELPLFVDTVVFSPDGSLLAVGYQPNRIVVWDAETGERLRMLEGAADWLRYPVFSPDGTLLAATSSDGRVLLWRVGA